MKTLILSLAILIPTTILSQEDVVKTDYIETTEIGKITSLKNGKITSKKVKIITRKEEDVMFSPNQKHQLNQDRIDAPIEVTKVIMTDKDKDRYYDKVDKLVYVLDKDNSLLDKYNIDIVNYPIAQTVENKNINFTGEGYFNKHGDYILMYLNSDNEKRKVLILNEVF